MHQRNLSRHIAEKYGPIQRRITASSHHYALIAVRFGVFYHIRYPAAFEISEARNFRLPRLERAKSACDYDNRRMYYRSFVSDNMIGTVHLASQYFNPFAQCKCRIEGADLLQEVIDQLLGIDGGESGNIINGFVRIDF